MTDKEESTDVPPIPPLEGDEEIKGGKELKFLTPNKLLTRLPILLAQIKAGDNTYKLKNEIIIKSPKSLQQFNQVIVIMEENMIVIRDQKTLCFNFGWPKDVDENLKHEIEFIIKRNESLPENKIKNEIEQLFLKYKHGDNIHKHRKQQSK